MKILELIAIPTLTGAGAPMFNLSRRIKQAGCELDIYIDQYRPHNLYEMLAAEGMEPAHGLWLSTIAPPHKSAADLFRLKNIIRNGGHDLIVCHLSHDHTLAALARALSGRRIPIVRCLHSIRSLSSRPLQKLLWSHADAVISHSENLVKLLHERFSFPMKRILYLPAEIDLQKFRIPVLDERAVFRSRSGFSTEDFVLGYVARIKPGRRHSDLITAFAARSRELSHLRLLIVGDGEILPEIKTLTENLGVSDRVVFTGFLSDDLPQAYMAMDAYIQAAVGNDASCRAVLEALACGVPVWAVPDAAACDICRIFSMDRIKEALGDIYFSKPVCGEVLRSRVEEIHNGSTSPSLLSGFFETLLKSAKSST